MAKITLKTIKSATPSSSAYFIRDTELKGFGLRVFPSGTIKYIVEVWHNGRSHRKTLGSVPILSLKDAKEEALSFIRGAQLGQLEIESEVKQITLGSLFENYTKGDRLKPSTKKSYRESIFFYLKDWLDIPVSCISKQMIEERFYRIRDKGMHGGIPTYPQATKMMRIMSALMNYAMADDVIQNNPVNVLKFKRVDRSIRKREHYLKLEEVRELLENNGQGYSPNEFCRTPDTSYGIT